MSITMGTLWFGLESPLLTLAFDLGEQGWCPPLDVYLRVSAAVGESTGGPEPRVAAVGDVGGRVSVSICIFEAICSTSVALVESAILSAMLVLASTAGARPFAPGSRRSP